MSSCVRRKCGGIDLAFCRSASEKINQFPNIDCFYCWLNTETGIYKKWKLNGRIYSQALHNGELSSTITLVISKYSFDKVHGFDESFSFGNDDDICFRLSKEFDFYLIPEPLAMARALDSNAMTKNGISLANGKRKLLEKYENDILTLLGSNQLARKYYELSNNYLLAGDFEIFKFYLKRYIIYINYFIVYIKTCIRYNIKNITLLRFKRVNNGVTSVSSV